MGKELQLIGFRIGREKFGVPIGMVREIVRMMKITAVPEAPDYMEGVINLRGRIIPVMDLRKRFREPGIASGQAQPHTRGRDGRTARRLDGRCRQRGAQDRPG